jgi:hypothetical protein
MHALVMACWCSVAKFNIACLLQLQSLLCFHPQLLYNMTREIQAAILYGMSIYAHPLFKQFARQLEASLGYMLAAVQSLPMPIIQQHYSQW